MNVNWEETFLNTYGTPELTLVRGHGSRVWDVTGREYIDLLGALPSIFWVPHIRIMSRLSVIRWESWFIPAICISMSHQ